MASPLVAIYEGMIADEREAERGCLFNKRRIKLPPSESHAWLGEGRLQCTQIQNAGHAS
jgi:hypothetical protein